MMPITSACCRAAFTSLGRLAAGSWLGVGNDPVYVKTRCFETFPFPAATEAQQARIRELGDALDAHRKRRQAEHPKLTLTNIYNVLAKLRAEEPLNSKEQVIHEQGLVSVFQQIHDDLDVAVFDAYGWNDLAHYREEAKEGSLYDFETGSIAQLDCTPEGFAAALAEWERGLDEEILSRLVALNAARATESGRAESDTFAPRFKMSPEAPLRRVFRRRTKWLAQVFPLRLTLSVLGRKRLPNKPKRSAQLLPHSRCRRIPHSLPRSSKARGLIG